MKLIDRDKLIREIEEEIDYGDEFADDDKLINKGLRIALKNIKMQQSIDIQSLNTLLQKDDTDKAINSDYNAGVLAAKELLLEVLI